MHGRGGRHRNQQHQHQHHHQHFHQQHQHQQQQRQQRQQQAPDDDAKGLETVVPAAEAALQYQFRDKLLLLQALTHRSYLNEATTATGDNDTLEWLGDSVLQHAVSDWLYEVAVDKSVHNLSDLRQCFVDTTACASYAAALGLPRLLRAGAGQAARGAHGKLAADCFEAVLGALYLDARAAAPHAAFAPVEHVLSRVIPAFPPSACSAGDDATAAAAAQQALMNAAHRLASVLSAADAAAVSAAAAAGADGDSGDDAIRDAANVVADAARAFRARALAGGELSWSAPAFSERYGADAAAAAADAPGLDALVSQLLDPPTPGGAGANFNFDFTFEAAAATGGGDSGTTTTGLPSGLVAALARAQGAPAAHRARTFSTLETAADALLVGPTGSRTRAALTSRCDGAGGEGGAGEGAGGGGGGGCAASARALCEMTTVCEWAASCLLFDDSQRKSVAIWVRVAGIRRPTAGRSVSMRAIGGKPKQAPPCFKTAR